MIFSASYYVVFSICLLNLVTAQKPQRQTKCSSDKFACISGECIENFSVCDGAKDCRDGSDETLTICSKLNIQCPAYSFRCAYGACVAKTAKCNGVTDCADNSDELLPECRMSTPAVSQTCLGTEFQCASGQCIDDFSLCDGELNCDDGSDETINQCINIKCPKYSFQCLYGACINRNLVCNGKDNCHDGSDEDDAMCRKKKPTKKPTTTPRPPPPTKRPTRPSATSTSQPPVISGGCPLPEKIVNGHFQVTDCTSSDNSNKCRGVPGTQVAPNTPIVITCNDGFSVPEDRNVSFCFSGKWQPPLPDCSKFCKPLISNSLEISCSSKGEQISCENPIPPKTKASVKCRQSYYISDPSSAFTSTECDISGEWDAPLFKCTAECGKPNYKVEKPLISFGQPTTDGEYPWHAGLYRMKDGVWAQACGGSIINSHIIMSAAHCLYNEATAAAIPPNEVKVTVGKYYRSWDKADPHEQKRDVSEIFLAQGYAGRGSSYVHDIALLDLVSTIIFSNFVIPVCLGFYDADSIPKDTLGTVVGWGLTEEKKSSETLQVAKLPYIDYDTCLKSAKATFKRYITYDKFCAGYSNGTGVQEGDSGGGLTFPGQRNDQIHYLHGIVSVKPRDEDTFAAFTNITVHKDWIERVTKALKKKHNT